MAEVISSYAPDTGPLYWHDVVKRKLDARDAVSQKNNDLLGRYMSLSQKLAKEVERRKELENEVRVLSSSRAFLPRSEKSSEPNFSESAHYYQKKIAELEAQVSTLKDERSELYKNQGSNAQRLLDMTDIIKRQEERSRASEEELISLRQRVKKLSEKADYSVEYMREKDRTIQVLQDELSTSHLELTKTDEKMKQLKAENSSLLQRWLKKMNEEAEHMNLANMLNETFDGDGTEYSSITNLRSQGAKLLSSITSPTNPEQGIQKEDALVPPQYIVHEMKPHAAEINCVNFSHEGSMLATASTDKKVMVFSSSGKHLQTLTGASQSVMYTEFSPSNELLLGASNDNSVKLWNIKTARLKDTLTGHIGKIYSAKFTADASKILSGSHDRTLKIWDLHRAMCIRTVFTFSSCNDVCIIDADATNVASGHLDNTLRFWDMRTGNSIKELSGIHAGQISGIAVSPDGTKIMSASRDNILKLFDLRTYDILQTFEAEGFRIAMNWVKPVFSPDGQYATAGSAGKTCVMCFRYICRWWHIPLEDRLQ
ncbi:hypothetical protein DSO57_1031276 [Entomophthora muscae]|uniref:Uncharacterized protein n=1 Tax=Entomophthora muscae TaxID=34485 RepID=A0ACC2RFE2_9FUNG|nr:hypothetical protein DSO57_1031276 [Entomophthora muscae]